MSSLVTHPSFFGDDSLLFGSAKKGGMFMNHAYSR